MNNNYNYYGSFNPYGNFTRSIPNNFNNNFRGVPNIMYGTSGIKTSGGFLSRLFPGLATNSTSSGIATATNKITFNGILNGASKTLGVINQAIPVFYQIKPIWNNAKTMLRVAKAMNSSDTNDFGASKIKVNSSNNIKKTDTNTNNSSIINEEGPTFFN